MLRKEIENEELCKGVLSQDWHDEIAKHQQGISQASPITEPVEERVNLSVDHLFVLVDHDMHTNQILRVIVNRVRPLLVHREYRLLIGHFMTNHLVPKFQVSCLHEVSSHDLVFPIDVQPLQGLLLRETWLAVHARVESFVVVSHEQVLV